MENKEKIVEILKKHEGWVDRSMTSTCLWTEDYKAVAEEIVKLFDLPVVSNWVAISSNEQPERVAEVMIKYKDGVKEVALFDGDGRYYIEKDDRDVTDKVIEWHRLP